VNSLLVGFAKVGDAWDATLAAATAAPRRVRAAVAVRSHRRTGLIAGGVVLVAYLFSVGDLVVSASGRFTGTPAFQTAPEQMFKARAPYLFEPVLAVHPTPYAALFLSPVNLLLAGVVAALVGCNAAAAALAARQAASWAAALLPVLIPLRPVFYPLTLVMLIATLVWGTSRIEPPAHPPD
jgi:hypothetical protein